MCSYMSAYMYREPWSLVLVHRENNLLNDKSNIHGLNCAWSRYVFVYSTHIGCIWGLVVRLVSKMRWPCPIADIVKQWWQPSAKQMFAIDGGPLQVPLCMDAAVCVPLIAWHMILIQTANYLIYLMFKGHSHWRDVYIFS